MYKTVSEYLKFDDGPSVEHFAIKSEDSLTKKLIVSENPPISEKTPIATLVMKKTVQDFTTMTDPRVWGPPFWFTLHNSAAYYPEKASQITIQRIKQRILSIPFELPCVDCRTHANNFINSRKDKLDDICSGRDSLFAFYVDFHNKVNERHNKPIMSLENAKKLYINGIRVEKISYY